MQFKSYTGAQTSCPRFVQAGSESPNYSNYPIPSISHALDNNGMPQVPEKFMLSTNGVPNYMAVTIGCPVPFGRNIPYRSIGLEPSTLK